MTECEECGRPHAIERNDRALCLPHWVELLGRDKPTGVQERVDRDRRKRERQSRAIHAPSQMHFSEFCGEGIKAP